MDRSALLRFLLIGLAVFAAFTFLPKFLGSGETEAQPATFYYSELPENRPEESICDIWTQKFRAQFGSRGASLKHFWLRPAKYQVDGQPLDLATTPDVELRRALRFHWRNEGEEGVSDGKWLVPFDSLDWKIVQADGKSCVFSHEGDGFTVRKEITTTNRPYELEAKATIKNHSKKKQRIALSIETTAWRMESEISGSIGRQSPFMTSVECVRSDGEMTRLDPGKFEPDDFAEPPFERNPLNHGIWHQVDGEPAFAAVSNMYFSQVLLPDESPAKPVCQATIEKRGTDSDPLRGAMYRSRLAYPGMDLAPDESATYSVLTYIGPKERDILAAVGGGDRHVGEIIDLGFFSDIAKVLVAFLLGVYDVIPNWGIAIIILTLTARTLLFPLTLPSIKNMVRMRELKPEMDAMNEKFKDDAQQRGLAQMELWRKHGVSPFKGCLPQVASMPVWFALYTTLQTAVELYNIPFLWFPDLSSPDPLYILPFIIGGTTFMQQKLIPQQGDATQQKMMLYFMPGMFIVFMFLLPSGLGVYMFTNGLIGIGQQQIVEWHVRRQSKKKAESEIGVEVKDDEPAPKKGKGKKKRSGGKAAGKDEEKSNKDDDPAGAKRPPLLGKGRA